MRLYNTPARQTEEVTPTKGQFAIYTCGPTVYDYPHVGNWFTFLRYDTLIRYLKTTDHDIKWVMNITDVGHLVTDADEGEDKLEKGARREGKTAWEIASYYSDYFIEGLRRLNITIPDILPKATDHISEQIALVEKLEAKGHTYLIDDGVYFDTSTFTTYADFAKLDLEDLQAGARVEMNPQKHNASDFALWKLSPPDQARDMEWDSPWGKGFPGWHLECSAMAMKYLGETLDIHAGGIDHIPVHHTNEIAQSEAATGKPFSRYWMHVNHISVNGQKISKSLGNGIILEDIEDRGLSLGALRLYALESHYRTQSKFTWEGLEDAQRRLQGIYNLAELRWQDNGQTDPETEATLTEYLGEQFPAQIRDALSADLNTPLALSVISELETRLHDGIPATLQSLFKDTLELLDRLFGLELLQRQDISDSQKDALRLRQETRTKGEWAEADRIRNQLSQDGVGVRDTPTGQLWFRLS